MKKLSLLSLALTMALIISFSNIYAQKSSDRYINYEYIQLPSHPLGIQKYDYIVYQNGETPDAEVEVDTEQDYDGLKQAYSADINYYYSRMFELDKKLFEIAKSKDLSLIKKQIEMGQINGQKPAKPSRTNLKYPDKMEFYITEMRLHDARIDSLNNAGLKMLYKSQVNTLISETKPVKPFYKKAIVKKAPYRLPDAIITQKMAIRGLEREYKDTNKIFFEIFMSEFESSDEKTESMGTHYRVLKCRRVVGYKVLDENMNIVDEGLVPTTDEWSETKFTQNSTTHKEISKKKKEIEKSSADNNLVTTRKFLARNYGHPIENRTFELSYAKGKKFNYENITEAYDIASNIFKTSLSTENADLSDLKKAIGIWEKELKEADYSNKKARISNAVAIGLYFNIIEGSIWLNEFDKAINLLDEVSKLKLRLKAKRKIETCRDFIIDRQERYEANNKTMAKN